MPVRVLRSPLAWLVAWTVLVWATRIDNVVGDDELSAVDAAWRVGVAALFLVGAAALVATRRALGPFVLWTCGYWLVRGTQIIAADHDLGFTVVHTVLMVVSISLAGGAWAWVRRAA